MTTLEVVAPGLRTLVQDAGRPGLAALGISACGAWDRAAHELGNRLVGNSRQAASLEVLLGGLQVRVHGGDLLIAVTGAEGPLSVDRRPAALFSPVLVHDGQVIELGQVTRGLRRYLSVRGGIEGDRDFGSLASDPTRGLGLPVVKTGDELAVGQAQGRVLGSGEMGGVVSQLREELSLRAVWGPRDDWFSTAGRQSFVDQLWHVTDQADRVGSRLAGEPLEREVAGELASEATVRGAVQVPASGLPVVFGPDHPTTGGYPVICVVDGPDADLLSQAVPGQKVRFLVSKPRVDLG